ncbi:MAG: restriction endonuclease subunit R [Flavobacterium sp. BFFFF1]|uniref:type I restriction endonuclease subunit R n=1 Tax=Flavobacterium sp. BFFFF1 TaxID=2015557 RepID=UPI000BD36DE5|nr:type I restriction endonuclease subunit R [Flavobacterium sp. BFFFF1]OYU79940.1 MAG: restriction endonuclease subunit R [Flavobacterium sp. BFFFF1]
MQTPSFKEDHSSQIPALQLLQKLGYIYLTPEEALSLRADRTSNVILEPILRKQLKAINSIQVSTTKTAIFSDANIENGILVLKDMPMNEGYIAASKKAFELLIYGKALEQSIDGDKKSFTLQYIDWYNFENNVFHVTEEYQVMRTGTTDCYRPDIVLFVNGIPLCIIECKRPDIKEPIGEAISQHIRNQYEDGVRNLYVYSQLLMGLAVSQAKYATTDTKEEFWAAWKETESYDPAVLNALVNQPLTEAQKQKLFICRTSLERFVIEQKEKEQLETSLQDEYLYWLCRPERLLQLVQDFILFEGGVFKKIARYQQYFAINKIMDRIQNPHDGRREGGVIWHTQGSGKSLTMAMLAKKIYGTIRNPKIVLVTDRIDLDTQITETFKNAEVPVHNAKTGQQLVDLLNSNGDAVITTVINKFEAAVKKLGSSPLESQNIFVLIDEGHRTQYGTFNVKMQKVLPNACFLAFTGTPLMKKEKSTAQKFGGIIDAYTILQAVEDKAIVPILYEGRHAMQDVNQKALDRGFDSVSESLSDYQKNDLKKKFSQANLISKTEQRIDEIARDISDHFTQNWGEDKTGERSGFKGMVVTPDKKTAIKYKRAFDLIGKVSTEVIISSPDNREGNEDPHDEPASEVVLYWKQMEAKYGKDFDKTIINQFKKTGYPELLIVVDKLLTGFDVPQVIVMYVCRKLREHTLLQAIARVNRVYPGKDFGFIIDYEGIIGELDEAMNTYSNLAEFEGEDLEGTFTDIKKEIDKLPQQHAELNAIFKEVKNKLDIVAYSNALADEYKRAEFYVKFSVFAKTLKMAFSSLDFENNTPENTKELYARHLKFYAALRNASVNTYSDAIDFKKYEKQLQKLLDQHVTTEEIIRLTEQVSIMDTEAFEKELEKIVGSRARAETIASRTSKHITERMDEDPVFYKKLSELIRQTISDLRANRISEAEAFKKLNILRNQAITKKADDTPTELEEKSRAIPIYRLAVSYGGSLGDHAVAFAEEVDTIINQYKIVDWQNKGDILRKMTFYIGEYLIDELNMDIDKAEEVAEDCLKIAIANYK